MSTWVGFDGTRTKDGTAKDCSPRKGHDKEALALYSFAIVGGLALGAALAVWL